MIDSNDPERFLESKAELDNILKSKDMNEVPLLVFANKKDLPNSRSLESVSRQLGLYPGLKLKLININKFSTI